MRNRKGRRSALSLLPVREKVDEGSVRRVKGDWALRPEREEKFLRWPTTSPPAAEMHTGRVTPMKRVLLALWMLLFLLAGTALGADAQGVIIKLSDDAPSLLSQEGHALGGGCYRLDSLEQAEQMVDPAWIEWSEPDYEVTLYGDVDLAGAFPPNDPYYRHSSTFSQWNLDAIGIGAAWNSGYYGQNVRVGVVDSGLVAAHEDLDRSHVLPGVYTVVEPDDPAYSDTADTFGHGSFVAGTIAARINNGVGVAGMTDQVELLPIKAFNGTKTSLSYVLKGIYYAIDHDCDVINMSFALDNPASSLKGAIDEAVEKGILVVAAVGNDGKSAASYPAAFDGVIGVASVNANYQRSGFSQYNESVFVTAPGEQVLGLGYEDGSSYLVGSGTSYSTPCVSAFAVMAKQFSKDVGYESFAALLRETAIDLGDEGYDVEYGYGLVNVPAFLAALEARYQIQTQLNGGIFPGEDTVPAFYRADSGEITLPTPYREGYAFLGWYADEACTQRVDGRVPAGSVGDRAFYAGWVESGLLDTEVTGVTVLGYPGESETGQDYTVFLPGWTALPALEDVAVSCRNAAAAAVCTRLDGGARFLVEVTSGNGAVRRTFTIRIDNETYFCPQPVESRQVGTAAPASLDGVTPAEPYEIDLSTWFTIASDEAVTYRVTPELGSLEGAHLTFLAAATDAGRVCTLTVTAQTERFASQPVTLTLTVGPLPANRTGGSTSSQSSRSDPTQVRLLEENGVVTYLLDEGEIGAATARRLAKLNQTKTVILSGKDVKVILPPGVLTAEQINEFLPVWTEKNGTGIPTLVREDAAGGVRPIVFATVEADGSIAYVAAQAGRCRVVWTECPFSDVPVSMPEAEAIRFAYARGILLGTAPDAFSPEQTMTRAMLATILYRMEGMPSGGQTGRFSDVPTDAWYAASADWACGAGLMMGVGADRFMPDEAVSAEELAVVLYRCAQMYGVALEEETGSGQWYEAAMDWAAEHEVVKKTGPVTRAELAGGIQALVRLVLA